MKEEISKRFVKSYYKLVGLELVKTKKDFCSIVQLSASNFKRIEDGERFATVEAIYHLHVHFKVNLDWIFTGSGEFIVIHKTKPIVDFTQVVVEKLEKLKINKDFDPAILTKENLEKCVNYMIDKHSKK